MLKFTWSLFNILCSSIWSLTAISTKIAMPFIIRLKKTCLKFFSLIVPYRWIKFTTSPAFNRLFTSQFIHKSLKCHQNRGNFNSSQERSTYVTSMWCQTNTADANNNCSWSQYSERTSHQSGYWCVPFIYLVCGSHYVF